MFFHLTALNHLATVMATLKLCLRAIVNDVLVHLVEDKVEAAVKETGHLSVKTLLI